MSLRKRSQLGFTDFILIPLAFIVVSIAAIKAIGSGRLPSFEIFTTMASRGLPLIVLVTLTAVLALYVMKWGRGTGSFGLRASKNCDIAVLEVGEIPSSYLLRERLIDEKWAQIFNALILSLTLRERPFGLHIHYDEGRGKIRIVFRKKPQDTDDYLVALVQSQLPGFTIRKGQGGPFPSPSKASIRHLRGSPHPSMEEVATSVSEFFELSISSGDYIAFFDPFRPSMIRRSFIRRKHKKLRAMGDRTGSAFGGADAAALSSIESVREIERFADRYALRTNLYLVAHSESVGLADRLVDDIAALIGGVSSDMPERVNPLKFADSLERLSPIGEPVIMSTVEARILFQFPRTTLGTAAPKPVECPQSMSDEGTQEGLQVEVDATRDVTSMPIGALAKQTLIMGSAGSGKTDLMINLLLDAYHNQIPFIIFSPLKGEYRALINALPEALLFTICNERVTPLRFNPLLPPSGTLNQTHIDNFRAAFETSYPLCPPMPYILNQCMTNMYVRNGWNLLGYERGNAVLLTDLYNEVEDYTRSLGHEVELKKDIEAALKIRIERLKEGTLGAMLNTSKPFPIDLFLSAPTIFEFDPMDDGEKGVIINLLLNAIGEQVQTLSTNEGTRLIIVVEEAHRLLGNIDAIVKSHDVGDVMRGATQYINNMLADMRAHGVGIILVDQTPSRLCPDAIRKSNTKILFRQLDIDSRILGTTMDLDERDLKGLASLRFGEAVVYTEGASHAHKIRVPDLAKAHGIKRSARVTDEEVRERMQAFYQLHPLTPYRQQVMGKGAYRCPVDPHPQLAPREAKGSLCAICSPNVGNCILQYLASEVVSYPDVQGKMTGWLSSSSIDIEELADYLLKLSETVLGEKNVKLSYCILARTRHDKVVEIARSMHRTIKIRYKHYSEDGAQR